MARLGVLGTACFVAAGIVAAIAVMPFSSWSFRNQIDTINSHGSPWGDNAVNFSANTPLLADSIWDRSKRDESLARAFAMRHRWTPTPFAEKDRYVDRPWFQALAEHEAKFPDDIEALASHIRLLCQAPMVKPATELAELPSYGRRIPQEEARQVRQRTEIAQSLLDLSTQGLRLEPENLYFSLCRTMALNVLGRFEEARQEVYRGAELKRFEDYAIAEAAVTIGTVERKTGYRGEAFRVLALASILLPHFAQMKGTVREMLERCPAEEKLKLQWALYREQYTLARDSSTYIGILVGNAGMNLALARQGEFQATSQDQDKREAEIKEFYRKRAKELAEDLRLAGFLKGNDDPATMLVDVQRLQDAGKRTIDTAQDPFFDNLFRWPALAGKTLLGILGLLIALPGLRFWAKCSPESFDRARGAAAVTLSALLAAVMANASPNGVALAPLALAIPMLALTIVVALGKSIRIAAIAVPIAALLVGLSAGVGDAFAVGGLAIVFMGAVWLSSRKSWAASLVALVSAGICLMTFHQLVLDSLGWLTAVPFALLAGILLAALPARWLDRGAAVLLLLLVAAYGVFIVQDVRDNAWLRQFNPRFITEAARVRKEAELPRLSQEVESPLPN